MNMIKKHFEYKQSNNGSDLLCTTSDHLIEIECYISSQGECTEIYLDGIDYSASSDTARGIFVQVDGQLYSLAEVIKQADNDWPDIQREMEREGRAEAAYRAELSSPQMTGRV